MKKKKKQECEEKVGMWGRERGRERKSRSVKMKERERGRIRGGTYLQLLVSMLCSKMQCIPCPLCVALPRMKQSRRGSNEGSGVSRENIT